MNPVRNRGLSFKCNSRTDMKKNQNTNSNQSVENLVDHDLFRNGVKIIRIVALVMFALIAQPIFAAVMGSTSYKLQSDSINFAGGFSTSTSYSQESTAGEIASGDSASATYRLHAGYQQMVPVYLSISVSPVNLTPVIPSAGGGAATGDTAITVTTDAAAGYSLFITASSSPALVSGINSFADYVPAGANPDFSFSVLAGNSTFGFTAEGTDISSSFHDNGSVCNAGVSDAVDKCWTGLTTSSQLIAGKSTGNHPSGSVTTLKFRAESGSSNFQPAGTYTATTTVTAVAL